MRNAFRQPINLRIGVLSRPSYGPNPVISAAQEIKSIRNLLWHSLCEYRDDPFDVLEQPMSFLNSGVWLVTGGCGFVGSEFIRLALACNPNVRIVNFDELSDIHTTRRLDSVASDPRYQLVHGFITETRDVHKAFYSCQRRPWESLSVIHFAAESRMQLTAAESRTPNWAPTQGIQVLLEAAKFHRASRFVHASTDDIAETSSPDQGKESPAIPGPSIHAGATDGEQVVRAFSQAHGLPVVLTRSCSNYGPWQRPSDALPRWIIQLREGQPLTVSDSSKSRRKWLHVEDHAAGILAALQHGADGDTYSFDGEFAFDDRTLVQILRAVAAGKDAVLPYAANAAENASRDLEVVKAQTDLEWTQRWTIDAGLWQTYRWFAENESWWRPEWSRQAQKVAGT